MGQLSKGTFFFNKSGGPKWFYAVINRGGPIKIKAIKEDIGTLFSQPVFEEANFQELDSRSAGGRRGRVVLPKTGQNVQLALQENQPGKLTVFIQGWGEVKSSSFEAMPKPREINFAGVKLTGCCLQSFETINRLPGLATKLDMVSLIGDAAAIVDSMNGAAQAINNLTQKAIGAPTPSSLVGPIIVDRIRVIVNEELNTHQRQNPQLAKFWKTLAQAWRL